MILAKILTVRVDGISRLKCFIVQRVLESRSILIPAIVHMVKMYASVQPFLDTKEVSVADESSTSFSAVVWLQVHLRRTLNTYEIYSNHSMVYLCMRKVFT